MYSKNCTAEKDFNGRQAANFVHAVTGFPYNIWIKVEDRQVNAKSILGLLSLGIKTGDTISICTTGNNEQSVDDIIAIFKEQ